MIIDYLCRDSEYVSLSAKELGCGILYLRTEHAGLYYERHGWEFVRRAVDEYGIATDVYRYIL